MERKHCNANCELQKLEDENLELRRIIHEMSQTETYLVQNAKLEMKIKRLEEERLI